MERLGRRYSPDPRDANYRISAVAPPKLEPVHDYRYWYAQGAWFDQGNTGTCVGHAWAHWFKDGPITQIGVTDPMAIYDECTLIDEWQGNERDRQFGTSVRAGAEVLRARGAVVTYRWALSWEEYEYAILELGPVVIGIDWFECVVPGTRVLTSGLEWLPVEKLGPGDELVGFDKEPGWNCKWRRATVLSNELLIRPCVRIQTDRGEVTVSETHRFVLTNAKGRSKWVLAQDVKEGDPLQFFGEPWEVDRSWEAGWLAGFYDGEGSLAAYKENRRNIHLLTCCQLPGPTAEFALKLLSAKGFDYGLKKNAQTGVLRWYLRGPQAKMRFLGSIRPERLLRVSERAWLNHSTHPSRARPAIVQAVSLVGREEVHAVGTSTGTLVTDGFLSHNSMFDPDADGFIHPSGSLAGGHAILLDGRNRTQKKNRLKNSWGRGWGDSGFCWLADEDLQYLLFGLNGECALAGEVRI
jgi:hypothetical protein